MKKQPVSLLPSVDQALSNAKKATKQGDLYRALDLYNAVLQHQAKHPLAKKGARKLEKLISQRQRSGALIAEPSQAELGGIVELYQAGQLSNAEQSCHQLLQRYPKSASIFNILGAILKTQGSLEGALLAFNKAIQIKPSNVSTYNNRGITLREMGRLSDALLSYDKAIKLQANYGVGYLNRGIVLEDQGELSQALASYDKAIKIDPSFAEAYKNKGNVLLHLGRFNEALENSSKAIQLKPEFVEAYLSCANAYVELGQLNRAVKICDEAIALKPDYAEAFSNRGDALRMLGKLEEAVDSCAQAIQLRPDYAEAYNNSGIASQQLGHIDAAIESYNTALKFKPNFAEAHFNLSALKTYSVNDEHVELMESLYVDSTGSGSHRMHLCFALAKAYQDLNKYSDSFRCLEEGNRLRNKQVNYSLDSDKRMFEKLKDVALAGIPISSAKASDSKQPLFIVGMPRSGTTLVEQIVASHSRVHGAGELNAVTDLVGLMFEGDAESIGVREITSENIDVLRVGYLEKLLALNVPEKIITDKMPLNFRWVAYILSAFPDAKIIHVVRRPEATCWSIYKHFFTDMGNGYAYDMDDLAGFYNLYCELMSFWRDLYPNNIYEICYEDLTENQEAETREFIAFCNLDWEDQCLNFHETSRAVKTASAAQVRQKMYSGSSEAWRNYEQYLQPMLDEILKTPGSDLSL